VVDSGKLAARLGSVYGGPGRLPSSTCSSNRTGEIPRSGMIVGPGGIVAGLGDPTLAGAPPGYPTIAESLQRRNGGPPRAPATEGSVPQWG
jgi:hypothetical protein